jgi:hypothetical protein
MKVLPIVLLLASTLRGDGLADHARRETRDTLAANPPAVKVEVAATPRLATKRPVFYLMLAEAGAAAIDVELTQHCIHEGTCYEANLFMLSNRWGQYGAKAGFITSTFFTGLGMRRSENKWVRRLWWIPQAANVGMSLYGASTGWRYR